MGESREARILSRARSLLEEEGNAILRRAARLETPFCRLVERILDLDGHVVVTGVGKSGLIGEKISATLSSTGTPSFFLRPVEALHGDLGMLRGSDVLLAISNSGETTEVLAVVSAARGLGVEIYAFTGNLESTLAKEARVTIDTGVEREACPLGLAPTASTTVTLAMGDALAMVVCDERGFTQDNYARFHPGGSLGERLRYRVSDLMRTADDLPVVSEDSRLAGALEEMTHRGNLGVTLVVSTGETRELVGILTDGDLRRLLLGRGGPDPARLLAGPVRDAMSRNPRHIHADASAKDALHLMEVHGITSLAVINHVGSPVGLIHLHDILGHGKIVL